MLMKGVHNTELMEDGASWSWSHAEMERTWNRRLVTSMSLDEVNIESSSLGV